jgi:hypothetical protein
VFERFQGPDWSYLNSGFNNDCWVAPSTTNPSESKHYAVWVPFLENTAEYNIEVFIPAGVDASTEAIYELSVKNENGTSSKTDIVVNQNLNPGEFIVIETMELPSGSNCSLILRDVVSSYSSGSNVVFDAVRFTNTSTAGISNNTPADVITDNIKIVAVYPNPFNASTTMRYSNLQVDEALNGFGYTATILILSVITSAGVLFEIPAVDVFVNRTASNTTFEPEE